MMRILSSPIPGQLAAAHALTERSTLADMLGVFLSDAIAASGYRPHLPPDRRLNALCYWLMLGRSLDVLSETDAYGSMYPRQPANTNQPGGKCSNRRRPRSAPRRRKPRLKVIER